MKNKKIAEEVKKAIMKDLFVDVNTQKCVIDIAINEPKEFEKIKDSINKVSITFLNKCKQQLKAESEKGNILFLKKYNYEKILNEHLAKTYGVDNPEMELFPSEQKMKEQEQKRIKEELERKKQEELEAQRLEAERKRKEREEQEREVLVHVSDLIWKKTMGVSSTVYETYYDGKRVELHINRTTKKKNTTIIFIFKYDKKQFHCVEYDGKAIVSAIEQTHPKITKKNNIIYVVNTENSAKKKAAKQVGPKELKKKQEEAEKRRIQQEENRRLKEEKRRLHEERMKAQEEAKRLKQLEKQERIRQMEEEQQEKLRQLPQIGVKDFVVRRAVFKCMHSKHDVVDLVAAVRVIGDDGKERLAKVSAGYCKQCKIYFIMESTYEKLRNMGVVLCRICDEKSYMKNSFVNGMRLAQESILMHFGYTVSQEEGLSSTRRQKILAVMIDNKVLSKSEIISYLDFFISQRQYQSKFELAVSKWEADRDFVQEYKVGQYTQFGVNAIYRR